MTNVRNVIPVLVLIWLIVGVIAAGQRGYITDRDQNCGTLGTLAVTVVAGPLNYLGVNPKVENCDLPQPSQ